MSLLIPDTKGNYASFVAFRNSLDWAAMTRERAKHLRRTARRHEQRLGELFNAGEATEAQFIEAAELEEALHVFVMIGERPA